MYELHLQVHHLCDTIEGNHLWATWPAKHIWFILFVWFICDTIKATIYGQHDLAEHTLY
jgi:hypothetical protein